MLESLSPIYQYTLKFAFITTALCSIISYTEPLNKTSDTQISAKTPDEIFVGVFNRLFPGIWYNKFKGDSNKDLMNFMQVNEGPFFSRFNLQDNLKYQVYVINVFQDQQLVILV